MLFMHKLQHLQSLHMKSNRPPSFLFSSGLFAALLFALSSPLSANGSLYESNWLKLFDANCYGSLFYGTLGFALLLMPLEKLPKILFPESTPGSPNSNPPSSLFGFEAAFGASTGLLLLPKALPKSANGSLLSSYFLVASAAWGYACIIWANGSAKEALSVCDDDACAFSAGLLLLSSMFIWANRSLISDGLDYSGLETYYYCYCYWGYGFAWKLPSMKPNG